MVLIDVQTRDFRLVSRGPAALNGALNQPLRHQLWHEIPQ